MGHQHLAHPSPILDPHPREPAGTSTAAGLEPEPGESEVSRRLGAILDSSDDAIIGESLDGIILSWNPGAARIYGYSADEAIGRPDAMLIPHELSDERRGLLERLRRGERIDRLRTTRLRKGGNALTVSLSASPIVDAAGRVTGAYTIARDITGQEQAYQVLEQRVEERTRELSTLLEVSHTVASTLELAPLLALILSQLKIVADYTGAGIATLGGERIRLLEYQGPGDREQMLALRLPVEPLREFWRESPSLGPVIVPNVRGLGRHALLFRELAGEHLQAGLGYVHSFLGIPLLNKERLVGMLCLAYHEPYFYTARHAALAMALGSQVSVALENARLYARAQEFAAQEERARLARDLHDAVTQMLFSAGLIAEVLPRLWDKDQPQGRRYLDDLRVLTRGALAEMRTLLVELRPAALTEVGLGDLLRQLGEAMRGRKRVPVSLQIEGDRQLPADVQIALYRVAQEALNNSSKHAEASAVAVTLRFPPRRVELVIGDNGKGFDPCSVTASHFGLRIMRERAAAIGADFELQSRPGFGTQISVTWTQGEDEGIP